MSRKSAVTVTLVVLMCMSGGVFGVPEARAAGTIYIKADGSVEPSTAPIHRNGNLYTFTNNVFDQMVIERDNIVVDGKGYAIQGTGVGKGIDLSNRKNVTIKNIEVKAFRQGIYFSKSSNNTISEDHITGNWIAVKLEAFSNNNSISGNSIIGNDAYCISLYGSCNYNSICGNNVTLNDAVGIDIFGSCNYNNVSKNHITNNNFSAIVLYDSSSNSIGGNQVANNMVGIELESCLGNSIFENDITNNSYAGIQLTYGSDNNSVHENNIADNGIGIEFFTSSNNLIYHNNFSNNVDQIFNDGESVNVWDKGAEGNYWSNYTGVDLNHDGIGDAAYVINANNTDLHPLMTPYIIPEFPSVLMLPSFIIAALAVVIIHKRKCQLRLA